MNEFMKVAIEEARRGMTSMHGGPFGAVIVKNGKIVGRGHNKVVLWNNPTLHGEMVAIGHAGRTIDSFDLSGCDIYTTGEPCAMCLCALMWANIKTIYYGCTKKDADSIGFRDELFDNMLSLDRSGIDMVQVDHKACRELFDDYAKLKGKTAY